MTFRAKSGWCRTFTLPTKLYPSQLAVKNTAEVNSNKPPPNEGSGGKGGNGGKDRYPWLWRVFVGAGAPFFLVGLIYYGFMSWKLPRDIDNALEMGTNAPHLRREEPFLEVSRINLQLEIIDNFIYSNLRGYGVILGARP